VAKHRALLRLDLILVVVVAAARATLAQPDGEENGGDAHGEQGLDDGTADPAMRN
jgi:hypothetical protein